MLIAGMRWRNDGGFGKQPDILRRGNQLERSEASGQAQRQA